ncbi:MAG: sulfatase family protein [Anaerolineae bacterium]
MPAETAAPETDQGFLGPHHDRLNVIQIMMDQLPYDALGCYGHPLIETPNIDQLAAQGVRFTNAYAQTTVCCPSRASQLSGLYPANHGITSNMANLEIIHPWARFLSDRFYEEEYATAHFGKWHCLRRHEDCKFTEFKFLEESVPIWPQHDIQKLYCDEADPVCLHYGGLVHAATHPCGEDNTGPARITDYSVEFMERFAYQPFFLRVSYLGPHAPVLVPRPYDTMYDPADVEIPDYPYEEFANRPEAIRAFQQRSIRTRAETPEGMRPEQAIRTHVAYNLGLISHIDDQIGRLLAKLRDLNLEGQTLILFTADHGGFWGEHGLLEKSLITHYRRLLQLPLIIRCPGVISEGQVCDDLIEEIDFYPTLLDFAGISYDYRINGQSFRGALSGEERPYRQREDVFAEGQFRGACVASLRDTEWNFIWHAKNGEAELYDLQADPDERHNLAGNSGHRDVVAEKTTALLNRILLNRDVHLLPDEIHRSPIYLTPGHDAKGHEQALISRFLGHRADEFPKTAT